MGDNLCAFHMFCIVLLYIDDIMPEMNTKSKSATYGGTVCLGKHSHTRRPRPVCNTTKN